MKISLAKLEAKRGEARRELAAAQKLRKERIEALDAKEAQIDDLSTKIQAKIDAKEDAGEDQKAKIELQKEYKELRAKAHEAADRANDIKSRLDALDEDYRLRAEHNDTENFLTASTGENSGTAIAGELAGGTSAGQPGGDGESAAGASAGQGNVRVLEPDQATLDHDLGVMFQAQIIAQIDNVQPDVVARDYLGNDRVASAVQQAGDFSRGGAWIQGVYSDRFIELLRPMSIMRQVGIDELPLEDGSLTMPEETAGPAGKYLGENEPADVEEVKTGQVKLVAKELVVQVVSSEKLLRSRSARAAERIRRSVLRGAGQTEDLYFLRGTKDGAGPTGMRYEAHADNVFAANGTINTTNVIADLTAMELKLLEANVMEMSPFWIMAPRTLMYLADLRDADGWVFPSLRAGSRTLNNKPVYTTTQIPINGGGGGNESEIMLGEASYLAIGDVPEIGFQSSNTAAYNQNGTTKAAFSNRQVVTRLVMENDFRALQKKAISVLTGVTWGA